MQRNEFWRTGNGRFNRRRLLAGGATLGLGVTAAGLVGCGDDDDDDGGSATSTPDGSGNGGGQTPSTSPTSSSGPARGGTLNLPGHNMSEPFDTATVAARAAALWNLIGDSALALNDKEYTVEERMIESWEAPSETEVVLKLRQGITWHDIAPVSGRAVTSEDIANSIMFHAGKLELEGYAEKTFHRRGNFTNMESAEATDESTIVLTMSAPSSAIFYGLADYRVRMIPAEQIEIGFEDSNKLIGSGPFVMTPGFGAPREYGSPYKVSRNPNYMNPDMPLLDEVEIKYIIDPAAQDSAIISGTIDALSLVNRPAVQIDALAQQSSDIELHSWDYAYWHWLLFNMQRPTWQDKRVRQAIHLALDYKALGDGFYGDRWSYSGALPPAYRQEAIPSDEISQMAGWNPETKEEDRAEAAAMLEAAGYPNGEGLNVTALIFSRGPHFANATRIKDQLESVFSGMSIELVVREDSAAFFSQTNEGDWDFNFYGIFPTQDPTLHLIGSYGTEGGRNYGKYSNPEVDEKLRSALAELDDEARKQLLLEVQNTLNDDLPFIPLYTANLGALVNKRIGGFVGDNRPGPGTTSYHLEEYARYMYLSEGA